MPSPAADPRFPAGRRNTPDDAPPGRVIDAAGRFARPTPAGMVPSDAELEERRATAATWWTTAFAGRGLDLSDPVVAEAVQCALGAVNLLLASEQDVYVADPSSGVSPEHVEEVRRILRAGAQSAARAVRLREVRSEDG